MPSSPAVPSRTRRILKAAGWMAAAAAGRAAAGYVVDATLAWFRYGRPATGHPDDADPLLDRCMPAYEVVERHRAWIHAPADIVFAAASETGLDESALVRAIVKTRAIVLGARGEVPRQPRGLIAQVKAMGWAVLAEVPGREVVMGAVTQPWQADVVFRGLPVEEFVAFREPGYVKIAWTLRVDPVGVDAAVFRTETRVVTTDPRARAKFRWYWTRFSPGIVLIRRVLVRAVKAEAERRVRAARQAVLTIAHAKR